MKSIAALTVLTEQFASPGGFLPRLQRGEGIDRKGVEQVWQSLDVLQVAWAEQDCIPAEAILVLMQVDDSIFACIDRYSDVDDQRAVEDLGMEMYERVQQTIMPAQTVPALALETATETTNYTHYWDTWCRDSVVPESPLGESEALAIVKEHLAGPGFLVALRCELAARDPVCLTKALTLIHMALDTLAPVWARYPCIAKDLASWFVQLRFIVTAGWTLYENWPDSREAHQLLLRIADELSHHLQRSLQQGTLDGT